MSYEALSDPEATGLTVIKEFVGADERAEVLAETQDINKVQWLDTHETFVNARGLTIVQNHFTYALKLSHGDQSPLTLLRATNSLYKRTDHFVKALAPTFPSLASWQADEMSFHLYDTPEVGLSRHRDNARFVGVIAILAIDGECDLTVRHEETDVAYAVVPGDLCLLRAPGLIDTSKEVRPEHSVGNLKTDTRLSMMLRANSRPDEAIPGFQFNNW